MILFNAKRHLLDIDEKDAGSGSILDIFSMDFEGDSSEAAQSSASAVEETPKDPAPETPAETIPESSAIETQSTDEAGTDEGAQVSAPAQEPEQVAQPAPSAVPSSDALLADAMKAIANLTQKREEPKKEAAEEDDEDAKVFKAREFSDYTFNISPKLYNGLFNPDASEEERIMALQGFASGIATTVHNNIVNSLGNWTREQVQAIPGVIKYMMASREQAQSSAKSIRDDFYGSFPELNKPELAPLVRATIQSIQKETKATTWTPQIKNLVGSRVKSVLAAYAQAAGGVKQVAPKVTKASTTPAPVAKTQVDPNSTEAIWDIIHSDF